MSAVHSVTDGTFVDAVLLSDKPVLVDFWVAWCPPCRAVAPILDELADEYASKIEIVKLNVDENPETAGHYGVTSIPTIKVFQGGRPVETVVGALPKPALKARLRKYLTT